MISSLGQKLIEYFGEKIYQAIVESQKTIIKYGDTVGIMACDGRFVMNDLNAENRLFAREKHVETWETLRIVNPRDPYVSQTNSWVRYNDQIALMAMNTRTFVGTRIDHDSELTSVVTHVQAW